MSSYPYAGVHRRVRPHDKTNGLPFIVQEIISLLGLVQDFILGTSNTTTFSKILTTSTNEQTPLSQPTSAARNTLGREQAPQNLVRHISDEDLREYYDKNYYQILPIIAEKLRQEKAQQEKFKAVKACLNFKEASQYYESETPNRRRNLKEILGPRLGDKEKNVSAHSRGSERKSYYSSRGDTESCYQSSRSKETETAFEKHRHKREYSRITKAVSESEGIAGGHGKSKPKKQKSSMEDDLSQPWVYEETDPFTPRIRYFDFPKTRMPSHIKTYDGSEDPKDHLKIFQAAAKTELWAMPTWCHMFNSTLTENARVWFDDLPKESVDSYDDLRKAFLENYLQRKKCIKDPVEIHNIKQRNGESTEEFVRRYKLECMDVKGASECMKISGFMHEITNPELIKRLHDKIPKSMDEIMSVTTTFVKGEITASREEDGTEGPMIIEAAMGGHCVHRIYVDGGSSLEILYEHCFSKFRPKIKNQLIPANTPLVGFSEEIIWPLGQISLLVRICDEEHSTSAWINFMVVRSPSSYNGIIERPGVRKIRAIPSTAHEMIKFPVAGGIVTLQSSRIIPLECSMVSESGVSRPAINQVREEKIQKPTDMTGVPRHIAEHRLNVREGCLTIWQKKRGQAPERNKAVSEEVKKLVEADIMKEVHYHSWLLNPVMAKKHDDSWRMCIDFKDLNKACPKDGYPLPEIDWKKRMRKRRRSSQAKEYSVIQIPFGLKNAGATYQRLVDKAFQKQISQNLEVYVDDLVIKSRTEKEVIRDSEETFKTLRKINMKINPKKCAFGMREGTFLGYKVDADGLRVSPDKVESGPRSTIPKVFKDMQKLNGKLASLKRFLSKSAEKSLPFFKTLKKCTKKSDFQWTPEAEGAFKEMKQSRAELSMLTAPKEKEVLIMYLAAVKKAINAILMTERDGKQVTVYSVSRTLQGPEINYTLMEKLILALDDAPDTPIEDRGELPDSWILFTDGSSCIDEYEALIAGLRIARQMRVQNLQANVDSKLVANQVNKIYIANESSVIRYLEKIKNLANTFKRFSIKQIPRGENKKADTLSKVASTSFTHLSKQVLVEELREKAIDEKQILAVVEEEGHTWMTPVYVYLTKGILPEKKKKARTMRRNAGRYAVINKVFYKKSFLSPWLRCVGPLQANYVLREIHEGSCSMHTGPRSVVAKALRSGYFWQTMVHTDARNLIRECKDSQVHRPVPRNPQEKLTPITSPWPFYKWGIDIVGPFSEGPSKVKFLIVAADYFTKCIEARPVATITGTHVKKFIWDNIVCGFGLPGEIVSDNGKQFRDNPFKDWNQGAKPKWKDITTLGFEAPAFIQETLSTGATKQAMRKTEASSDLSGMDHMKSRKHWAKEHTVLETAMDTPFRENEIGVTLKSAICMKCKHPLHVKQSGKKTLLESLCLKYIKVF
nr:reverse transcriptase domain-containing protein [Tanacetum cinerariifolium]